MSAYVTKPISTCERVSRALSALLSELHFPTRALGPITEARDLLLRAALDANEFYSTERDELTRDVVKLRADLAAAVAERDEACTAYQVRSAEWHQYELIALALAERYKLRAEQAEARLSAIDAAPVVAWLSTDCIGERYLCFSAPDGSDPVVELIARTKSEAT